MSFTCAACAGQLPGCVLKNVLLFSKQLGDIWDLFPRRILKNYERQIIQKLSNKTKS